MSCFYGFVSSRCAVSVRLLLVVPGVPVGLGSRSGTSCCTAHRAEPTGHSGNIFSSRWDTTSLLCPTSGISYIFLFSLHVQFFSLHILVFPLHILVYCSMALHILGGMPYTWYYAHMVSGSNLGMRHHLGFYMWKTFGPIPYIPNIFYLFVASFRLTQNAFGHTAAHPFTRHTPSHP